MKVEWNDGKFFVLESYPLYIIYIKRVNQWKMKNVAFDIISKAYDSSSYVYVISW